MTLLEGATPVVALFTFAIAVFLADRLRSWYRLSHVPGPFWAAFSKHWLVRHSLEGRQPYAIQEANEKYGEPASQCPQLHAKMVTEHIRNQARWCALVPMSWQPTIPRCCGA